MDASLPYIYIHIHTYINIIFFLSPRFSQLFANVVTSDKLAKPYSKASSARPGGESWSLPVAVGPLRMEKDKGKLRVGG